MARSRDGSSGWGWAVALGLGALGFSLFTDSQAEKVKRRRVWFHSFVGRVREAAAYLGVVHVPPVVEDFTVANAASDGSRILVNTDWVGKTLARFCNDEVCHIALVLGVAAHELAHHLNGHAKVPGNNHQQELEADWFAGLVLRRAGVPSDDFERVIHDLAGCFASPTHPAGPDRVAAIRAGYTGRGGRFM